VTDKLEKKLAELPKEPGVYFHKNARGKILYIGKAAVLRNRVRQYFQKSRNRDPKTEALVAEIADIDWMVVESEIDALFLEAEMVRRYLPPYNILLRDDKSVSYVRISYKSDHPTVTLTRRPLDDGAEYFGPYFNAVSVRRALKYLRRPFPYSTHTGVVPKRACLQYHLGLCPGLEESKTSLHDYRANLKKLMQYLKGERVQLIKAIEREMKQHAKASEFEKAAAARNQLFALRSLSKQIIFSDKEFMDISKDQGLTQLAELLGLYEKSPKRFSHSDEMQDADEKRREAYDTYGERASETAPQQFAESSGGVSGSAREQAGTLRRLRRIEGYDISHQSGTDNVASMVVFSNGVPDKAQYRKFKMRVPGNDDFAHMKEVITRRLSEENRKNWSLPDLFLIDGGKGQLSAALEARNATTAKGQTLFEERSDITVQGSTLYSGPMIGLAKREEQIVISRQSSGVILNEGCLHELGGFVEESEDFLVVTLPRSSHVVKLLQRIRDESHRFAVSYHSVLKTKRQTASLLDDIPTIGPATRKKLLRYFGSMKGVMQARQEELDKLIGAKKATILRQYLRAHQKSVVDS
jgi:excinuclease ABC subunit C